MRPLVFFFMDHAPPAHEQAFVRRPEPTSSASRLRPWRFSRSLAGTLCATLGVILFALAGTTAHAQQRSISIAGMGHDKGTPGAPVYMVEFGDFGCGYCAKFAQETWPILDSLYLRTGRLRFKYVPFVTGMFRHSRDVSIAAECAGEQQAFWKMHDLLYERRTEWMKAKSIHALLGQWARELRLNEGTFARCTSGKAAAARIDRNTEVANSLYIRGTPTFFVNGQVIPGLAPLEIFKQIIEGAKR